jgi:hypothetical protein
MILKSDYYQETNKKATPQRVAFLLISRVVNFKDQ